MSLTSTMVRTLFTLSDRKRDRGLTVPDDLIRSMDIPYGPDSRQQTLDVYRPRSEDGRFPVLPVIVSVHGGGWVYGSKELYQYYCMDLAERGFAVVNFSYRLAPGAKFPAQLEDVNAVFHWVLDHAEEHGFDTGRIFAVGDSAGGHLLGLFCDLCVNPDYAANFSFRAPEGFVPRAVALNCGAFHIDTSDPKDLTTRLMKDLMPTGGRYADLSLLQVADYVAPGFPPTYLMTCAGDFLIDQPKLMMKAFERCGVPYTYKLYGSEKEAKDYGHVFHLNIKTDRAKTCNDTETVFFKNRMGDRR